MDIVDKGVVLKKNKSKLKAENSRKFNSQELQEGKDKKTRAKVGWFSRLGKIAVIIFGGFLAVFTFMSTRGGLELSYYQKYDQLISEEEPFVLIIYDSKSSFSQSKESLVSGLAADLREKIAVLQVEYDFNDDKTDIFIDKYQVETLPVIIVCDNKGNSLARFSWPWSEALIYSEVDKALVKYGSSK